MGKGQHAMRKRGRQSGGARSPKTNNANGKQQSEGSSIRTRALAASWMQDTFRLYLPFRMQCGIGLLGVAFLSCHTLKQENLILCKQVCQCIVVLNDCWVLVQAELAHDEREAAELAGVTWQPEISKMAQTLQRRDADEDSFMRLTRTCTNKTQVTLSSATDARLHFYAIVCISCKPI